MSNRNLRITGNHRVIQEPHVDVSGDEDVVIVVTQAYGPKGDQLVGISDVTFDGHPAVTLGVRAGGQEGLVHLSPIHGDSRKQGFIDIAPGTVCELYAVIAGTCQRFTGWRAGFLVGSPELERVFQRAIGRPRIKKPLANANLRAYFYLYEL